MYQQTFLDAYAKVAFVKLYDLKNALVAAGLLNDRVLPFFEEREIPLLRGQREHHEYELYLAVENTAAQKLGIHRPTDLRTFPPHHSGRISCHSFRKKLYTQFGEPAGRPGMTAWPRTIGHARTRASTAMARPATQTFLHSVSLAREKMPDAKFSSAPAPEPCPAQRSPRRGAAADTAA